MRRATIDVRREGDWLVGTVEHIDSLGVPRTLEARINMHDVARAMPSGCRSRACCHHAAAGAITRQIEQHVHDQGIFIGASQMQVEAAYKAIEQRLPPPVPSGPSPTSGLRARRGPGNVAGRFLSTLKAPRKQVDRSIGDEFSLLVQQFNRKFKKSLPLDPYDPRWRGELDLLQNILGRIATGRVNAYQCAAGRGHCPHPGLLKQLGHAFSDIGKAIGKIPVLGTVVHAALAPVELAVHVAKGERLDHALLGALKSQVAVIKEVAPYATTVLSLVPGVGTGLSAAIAAGAALAEGRPITEAALAAVRGAIPGGPLVTQGFDAAVAIAKGKRLDRVLLDTARSQLPTAAQKAFDVGVAVASGRNLQSAIVSSVASLAPQQMKSLIDLGAHAIKQTPGLAQAAHAIVDPAARSGFQLAAGMLSHSGVSETALKTMRSKLGPEALKGFDHALASQLAHHPWIGHVLPHVPSPAAALRQLPAALHVPMVPHAALPPSPAPPRVAPHVLSPGMRALSASNAMLERAERSPLEMHRLLATLEVLRRAGSVPGPGGDVARRALDALDKTEQWRKRLRSAQHTTASRMAAAGAVGGLGLPPSSIPDPMRLAAAGVRPGSF